MQPERSQWPAQSPPGPPGPSSPNDRPIPHPAFIQVAKPYIFEKIVQDCIAVMGVNPLREEALRLQGVAWIDGVRRVLNLYVGLTGLDSYVG